MHGFLYFVKVDRPMLTPSCLRELGLGYAVEGDSIEQTQVAKGPDGSAGIVAAPGGGEARHIPDSQNWKRGPKGMFWVGWEKDVALPGPDDLQRARLIGGHALRLRDGREWTVPVARSIVRGSTLPSALVLGEDGETWESADLDEFKSLCSHAEAVDQLFAEGAKRIPGRQGVSMDRQQAMKIAVEALAVNYRIGAIEASILRLFSTAEMWAVLRALIDMPTVEQMLQEMNQPETEEKKA